MPIALTLEFLGLDDLLKKLTTTLEARTQNHNFLSEICPDKM